MRSRESGTRTKHQALRTEHHNISSDHQFVGLGSAVHYADQFGKALFQGRTRGQGMRRFETARALDFVTPENLGVSHDCNPGLLSQKPARDRADMNPKSGVQSPGERILRGLGT